MSPKDVGEVREGYKGWSVVYVSFGVNTVKAVAFERVGERVLSSTWHFFEEAEENARKEIYRMIDDASPHWKLPVAEGWGGV